MPFFVFAVIFNQLDSSQGSACSIKISNLFQIH